MDNLSSLLRALRTVGYGFTSVLLGVMLTNAGVSTVHIGLLLGVAALGSITFSIVMGMYADRIGRKRSLVDLCPPNDGYRIRFRLHALVSSTLDRRLLWDYFSFDE